MRKKINDGLMRFVMIDPLSTYIDAGVEIGVDTVIYPQTDSGGNKGRKRVPVGPGRISLIRGW